MENDGSYICNHVYATLHSMYMYATLHMLLTGRTFSGFSLFWENLQLAFRLAVKARKLGVSAKITTWDTVRSKGVSITEIQ